MHCPSMPRCHRAQLLSVIACLAFSAGCAGLPDPIDAPSGNGDAADQSLDGGAWPPAVSCGSPEAVGSDRDAPLGEPALSVDGLTLYAHSQGELYVSQRKGLDLPFGAWTSIRLVPGDPRDLTVFVWQGEERAIIAARPNADADRVLEYCAMVPSSDTCETISVVDALHQTPIADDLDGPSVAVVDGTPIMVFNVSIANQARTADVFEAVPDSAGDFTRWLAHPLEPFDRPNTSEDDPTIAADGTFVVVASKPASADEALFVSFRQAVDGPLSAPVLLLPDVSAGQADPCIFQLSERSFEIYFSSATISGSGLARALCTISR